MFIKTEKMPISKPIFSAKVYGAVIKILTKVQNLSLICPIIIIGIAKTRKCQVLVYQTRHAAPD